MHSFHNVVMNRPLQAIQTMQAPPFLDPLSSILAKLSPESTTLIDETLKRVLARRLLQNRLSYFHLVKCAETTQSSSSSSSSHPLSSSLQANRRIAKMLPQDKKCGHKPLARPPSLVRARPVRVGIPIKKKKSRGSANKAGDNAWMAKLSKPHGISGADILVQVSSTQAPHG